MKELTGYNEAQAFTGESTALPAGKYVCEIKGAKETKTQNGKGMLVLQLDIAEGDHKGYYSDAYAGRLIRNPKAKWPNGGLYRQGYEDNALPFFKGMITSIEQSNEGFKWDWDEKKLKGKKIGVLFGREQFLGDDGKPHFATKAVGVRSLDGLKDAEVPADKLLSGYNSGSLDNYEDIEDDDVLPF